MHVVDACIRVRSRPRAHAELAVKVIAKWLRHLLLNVRPRRPLPTHRGIARHITADHWDSERPCLRTYRIGQCRSWRQRSFRHSSSSEWNFHVGRKFRRPRLTIGQGNHTCGKQRASIRQFLGQFGLVISAINFDRRTNHASRERLRLRSPSHFARRATASVLDPSSRAMAVIFIDWSAQSRTKCRSLSSGHFLCGFVIVQLYVVIFSAAHRPLNVDLAMPAKLAT